MSVVKSKRREDEFTVFVKANDLAVYTLQICSEEKRFPKRYRWCITNKIVDDVIEINSLLHKANAVFVDSKTSYEMRRNLQTMALATTQSLQSKIMIATKLFKLDGNSVEYWTGLLVACQNQIRSWRTSEKKLLKEFSE